MRTIEDTAAAFDGACRAAGVGYAIVGAFAVSTWGQPRTTSDIDALVVLDPARLAAFARALHDRELACSADDLGDALDEGGHVTAFDEQTSFHVDMKVASSAAEREQVAAARQVPFQGKMLRVVRPEDTVAYKLMFGSEQDVKDARSILARLGGALDRERLEALATRLGVAERLRQVEQDTRGKRAEE